MMAIIIDAPDQLRRRADGWGVLESVVGVSAGEGVADAMSAMVL
jgi:hypothetical protein